MTNPRTRVTTGNVVRLFVALLLSAPLLSASILGASPMAHAADSVQTAGTDVDAQWRSRLDAHLDAARQRTLDACATKGLVLPPDFLAWIDGDSLIRASVYGCRKDPLPVILALRSLEIDLGPEIVRRDYTQLALAFAINGSYRATKKKASTWNDGDDEQPPVALADITPRPPLVLTISGDPRVRVDTKDPSRPPDRDDHIINFLEDHEEIEVELPVKELPPLEYDENGVAKPQRKPVTVMKKTRRALVGADVIASAALQAEFNEYMKAHGHPDVSIDCGDRLVHWLSSEAIKDKPQRERIAAAHDLFHAAYRAKGRMPAERDAAPTPSESMAWFIRNDRHPFSDTDRAARSWPRFPLTAPWPLLMMLAADDQPLREREDMWVKFRDAGEMRTYGEYIGGIAQQFDMQSARRVSPYAFSYGSIQMMWKDGGVCGTMGNIGARTYRICGVPSSTAGQPGHCAIVFMEHDAKTGHFRCKGGQYATGGDEVTTVHAGWNYDDIGGRRPMVFHQTIASAVNHDFESLLDAMVMRRVWDQLPPEERARDCENFLNQALDRNPFALVLVDAALSSASDVETLVGLLDAFNSHRALSSGLNENSLYRTTVRGMAHARIAKLPSPTTREASAALLAALERQECDDPKLLARCWREVEGEEGFVARCRADVERYLASAARTKNKRVSSDFADRLKAFGQTVKGPEAKKAWAIAMLDAFAGHETLTIKKKDVVDPSVLHLCTMADRTPPSLSAND
jgi:hypothetical protein